MLTLYLLYLPLASVERLSGVGPRGEPGGGAAGSAGEAELRAGPDEGAHVLSVLQGVRGGAGTGNCPQRPHQVRGDEQQVPERHQRSKSTCTFIRTVCTHRKEGTMHISKLGRKKTWKNPCSGVKKLAYQIKCVHALNKWTFFSLFEIKSN